MKQISLILLVVLAVYAIQSQKLRRAIIFMGAFSLCISFVYMLYNAPDVAIAEAVIGCTLSTILYLVALKKYRIFTVFYHVPSGKVEDSYYGKGLHSDFINALKDFCAEQELDPHIIYTTDSRDEIMENNMYSVILEPVNGDLKLHVHSENCKVDDLEIFLESKKPYPYVYSIVRSKEVIE
ncbi:Uncharacterized MnhB-related membrane protein [Dethiosulfatibacter aminovorans DSM 17477]|uniref:Uncharacterized MnhB-related membrane protein n=1 Tax=Dethiosulfatibacter aminovorans DSM 17477 TaxID=1121476 RepID=A0A1M6GSN2_9FIRM|nr:DUF4040 domain-containing protein [Dethiosulfatibacter aminovorans]SHJ12940.1 Uncharacterized MnhB-related membrane protein [Dethiosulfatibacter aminovorans DSM 17477]